MPDRILRADLFESDRWLDLQTTDARLLFVFLLTLADDYGNLEANSRRLFRAARNFLAVDGVEALDTLLADLIDADLVRSYSVPDPANPQAIHRTYLHIPRAGNKRRYWSRKCPQSPWELNPHPTTIEQKQGVAKKPAADPPQDAGRADAGLMRGVGVGVGVGVNPLSVETSSTTDSRARRTPPAPHLDGVAIPDPPTQPGQWASWFNRQHGTDIDPTSRHERRKVWGIFTAWCKAGMTQARITEAIARAQADAREPISNLVAYADRCLASLEVAKTAYDRSWRRSKPEIEAKGRALGLFARRDEDHAAFADRIEATERQNLRKEKAA